MASCKICRFQVVDDSVSTCPNCGAPLAAEETDDSHIDQVSPGLRNPADPGRQSTLSRASALDDDTLEICDPGDLLAADGDGETPDAGDEETPHEPTPMPDVDTNEIEDDETPASENAPGIQKLSDEQVDNIRSSMLRSGSDYVTPHDASSILHNLTKSNEGPDLERRDAELRPKFEAASSKEGAQSEAGDTAQPQFVEPATTMSQPVKSAPSRNIAYFHKNFVQLTGNVYPNNGEELVIEDRHYILRPKRFKPQYTIGAFAVLAAILLFIVGKQFISPTMPGSGTVVGVILDDSGRPLADGATLTLPEAGKSTTSDGIGFFRFDGVPTGTYAIKYRLPDGRIGSEHISVTPDDLTVMSLSTANAGKEKAVSSVRQSRQSQSSRRKSSETSRSRSNDRAATTAENATRDAGTEAKREYSALRLKTNVDDARLIVDGEILGRGDLTYKKLLPGTHSATVKKDGYHPWTGRVELRPGETSTLSVTLEKVVVEDNETEYTADDFYQSGKTQLAQGKTDAAIRDLTEAINLDPSLADAYYMRAEAYQASSKTILAEADFVRAGEIYRTQRRTSTAMDAFTKAIEINMESVPALLNRADLYASKDDRAAALDDYQDAVKYDRENFRANFELGKLYFQLGKHKDADKRLRKAKEIDPQVPEVYHYMMLNYFARDDFNKVKKTYGDFKNQVAEDDVQAFKVNPRFDAILRIVGEYERP